MQPLQRFERLSRIFIDYKLGRTKGRIMPLRLWLEPTNTCNLKCPVCPQSTDVTTPRGFIDLELYRTIISEARSFIHDVNLSHRGESLFHPNICECVAYAHAAGIKTRIHTNGTILTPELSRGLIEAGLDFLSFSFDGFTREDYERSRVGAHYDETIDHIKTFLALKQRLNSQEPFTVIQLIQTDTKPYALMTGEKQAFLAHFRGLPLNKLYIKEPHNWGGLIPSETAHRLANNQPFSPCTFCWYALTILWDGTVVPCPQDFYGVLKIGDAKESSLADIWRNQPIVDLREHFVSHRIQGIKPCDQCDRLFRKTVLGIPTVNMKEFLLEHLVGYRFLKDVYRRQWPKTGK
ncbi:SPASM domain-containing protein [bacterium]|nr:SPASM domain-containing protein [bacterium]